ncbi:hypothetical protein HDU93_009152, partial [Gonapodya sp. JEL0774]
MTQLPGVVCIPREFEDSLNARGTDLENLGVFSMDDFDEDTQSTKILQSPPAAAVRAGPSHVIDAATSSSIASTSLPSSRPPSKKKKHDKKRRGIERRWESSGEDDHDDQNS